MNVNDVFVQKNSMNYYSKYGSGVGLGKALGINFGGSAMPLYFDDAYCIYEDQGKPW